MNGVGALGRRDTLDDANDVGLLPSDGHELDQADGAAGRVELRFEDERLCLVPTSGSGGTVDLGVAEQSVVLDSPLRIL